MSRLINDRAEPMTHLRPEIPTELERIVNKALEKEITRRYQHIAELISDLEALKKQLESGRQSGVVTSDSIEKSITRQFKARRHFPDELNNPYSRFALNNSAGFPDFKHAKQKIVDDFERQYLIRVIDECDGVIIRAAKLAGMHTKNFYQKLRKHNISVDKSQ